MQLVAPQLAPVLEFTDIQGRTVRIGQGRRTLVSFFRDPACPFCNFRIFELTYKYAELNALGLDVVTLFPGTAEDIGRYAASRPRPFPLVADTDSEIYNAYGVNHHSLAAKLKAILTRIPTLIRGLRLVGVAGLFTNNLMPVTAFPLSRSSCLWHGA